MAEKQTHKDTIVIWHEAVQLFDRAERHKALENLQAIRDPPAKILFNIGHIQLLAGRSHDAVQTFKKVIEKDPHMGIAHFQLAQTHYQQQNYDAALQSLEKAHSCLRSNKFIDYKQLGLQYKLYECEILHNLALTYAALQETPWAIDLMTKASRCKSEARHGTIDSALTALKQGSLPKPFSVPEEHVFRPPAAKVQNLKGVDYLGKAKVVSELVVPDAENKRGRSPSPNPPSQAPPPHPSLPVPIPSQNFQPIRSAARSQSPNLKLPPSRPPPMGPGGNRASPSPPARPPPSPLGAASPSSSPTLGAKTTHKDTISMWNEGVQVFEKGQVGPALDQMLRIVDPHSRILFNIGMLQLKLGKVQEADEVFQTVVSKDPHLAIGHYQYGNVQVQLNRPREARQQYEKCLGCFRGHKFIDYKQLGLAYRLYEFEVLHNLAWAYYQQGQREKCRQLLREAQGTRPETKHDAIDSSLKNAEAGAPFDIMKLPKGALFRPPKAKIDNLSKIDFLGQAKVVSELSAGSDRSTSPGPTRASPVNTEDFYLPMASPNLPLSPPSQVSKPLQPPHKSLPTPLTKVSPKVEPPRKSLPTPQSRAVGQNLPVPVPPRSTSLGLQATSDLRGEPLPSPGLPSRPVPPIPIHAKADDSTIPRRTPPPPPAQQNGQLEGADWPISDRKRKVSPAFDPNKPLPVLPEPPETDEITYANTAAAPQRRVSPVPPSKPLPPSPNRNSPVQGRRTPGPPERLVPPSPSRLSPGVPNRTPPPVPSDTAQEQKRRPVSPLPPKAPLPPPPPGKVGAVQTKIGVRDANGPSPRTARKISQEALGIREASGINNNPQYRVSECMVAVESYVGKDKKELSFSRGEIIQQCREVSRGVLEGEYGGKTGRFPKSAVQELSYPVPS